jgi:diacylglycerol kinase (ATP)
VPLDVRHVAVVMNPTSGRGRGGRLVEPVAVRLLASGLPIQICAGRDAREAAALLAGFAAAGDTAIVALGGDGTVNLAAQAVAGTKTPFGVIPAGSGNDIARALGVPTDPLGAADVVTRCLRSGQTRAIDAVRAAGQWYVGVLGAGFDSRVNDRANRMVWPPGRSRYNLAIAAELRVFRPIPFQLVLDGEEWTTAAMLVAVGNGSMYGGGMRVCEGALLDDGLLDVTVLGPVSKAEFVRVFPRVYRGTHVTHPAVTQRRATVVTLDAPGVTAYADGERLAELPVTCEIVPAALHVLAPAVEEAVALQ